MARRLTIAIAALACSAATGCADRTPRAAAVEVVSGGDGHPATLKASDAGRADSPALASATNAFAVDLYHQLRARAGERGLAFSPLGLSTTLALMAQGAGGSTARQIDGALHLPFGRERVGPAYASLLLELGTDPPRKPLPEEVARTLAHHRPILRIANAVWVDRGYPVLGSFTVALADSFGAEVHPLDLRDRVGAARRINTWVRDRTGGLIPAVGDDPLRQLARVALTNAVYFKGGWSEEFNKAETQDFPYFVAPDRTTPVPMMSHIDYHARYGEDEGLQILERPYQLGRFGMVVLLPRAKDGLPAVEAALTPASLGRWLGRLESCTQAIVALPRFEVEAAEALRPALAGLGITDAFDERRADLSGIAGAGRGLFLSAALHAARVKVDEEGTEAASVNLTISSDSDDLPPQPPVFRADHPFLFLIRDRQTGVVLFFGRVTDPRHEPAAPSPDVIESKTSPSAPPPQRHGKARPAFAKDSPRRT
jgi:serpin B